jgi:nitrous oxide reductase accessory protein NosL
MKARPQRSAFAALIAALALAGCAGTSRSTPASTPAPVAASATADARGVITGSRIPSKSTEKMVRGIDGKDYRDNVDGMPDPLKSQ